MEQSVLSRAKDVEEASFTFKNGEPYWILHQTRQHTYLQLDEQDYFLWSMLDGEHTITDLIMEHLGRYHSVPYTRLENLLLRLRENGFLSDQVDKTAPSPVRRAIGYTGSGFWEIVFPIRSIDPVFSAINRYTGWIIRTRPVLFGCILVTILGIWYFVITEPLPSYPLLLDSDSHAGTLFWTYIAILGTAFLHEGGHAIACKAYGRRINNAGLVLYYGSPCLYVDTTDIWMAPPRARIIVSLAGPFVNIFIGSICSLLVWLFPDSGYATFIWRFAFLSYLIALVNLNPLLEFDGYYALSDLLEIPNLRTRAFTYIRTFHLPRVLRGEERIGRQGAIFLLYAIFGGIFTLFMVLVSLYIWEAHVADLADEILHKSYQIDHIITSLIIVLLFLPFIIGMGFQGYEYIRNRVSHHEPSDRYR